MARTHETYYAVVQSPLLSEVQKQVYHMLWEPVDGLTKGEIAQRCEYNGWQKTASEPWEKAVPALVKMGLVQKGSKRHCTAKQKEDVVWLLTDSATPIKPKANKPSAKQYFKAVAQMEMMIAYHDSRGDGMVTPELTKLYEWVKDKLPESKNG